MTVYTDLPDDYAGIADDVVRLGPEEVATWAGPLRHLHRGKILVLKDILERFGETAVLLDTDTFFKEPPERLFERIGPGSAVMERVEPVFHGPTREMLEEALRRDPTLGEIVRPDTAVMWNAGVIGLDPAEAGLLGEVLALNDQLYGISRDWYTEQVAFGLVLGRRLELRAADDVVYHYCHPVLKRSFERRFQRFAEHWGSGTAAERAAVCMTYRPRWDAANTLKILAKRALKLAGCLRGPIRFDLT